MKHGLFSRSRSMLFAAIFTSATLMSADNMAGTPKVIDIQDANLGPSARIEVRLRKLHLVRPDLIQYPIQYEVYC